MFALLCPCVSPHLSCWPIDLCRCPCHVPSTRFTASVMLARDYLLLSSPCSDTSFVTSAMPAPASVLLFSHHPCCPSPPSRLADYFSDLTTRPCPSHASLHIFYIDFSPFMVLACISRSGLGYATKNHSLTLLLGITTKPLPKNMCRNMYKFSKKTVQTRKKETKRGIFEFLFYTLLLGNTT
jgi:hypothetical protein